MGVSRGMRALVLGSLLVVATFAGVLVLTAHLVTAHAVHGGTPEYAVRLASWMTGLFAAGIAALLVGFSLLFAAKKRPGP